MTAKSTPTTQEKLKRGNAKRNAGAIFAIFSLGRFTGTAAVLFASRIHRTVGGEALLAVLTCSLSLSSRGW